MHDDEGNFGVSTEQCSSGHERLTVGRGHGNDDARDNDNDDTCRNDCTFNFDGSTQARAGRSCKSILDNNLSRGNANYWIDPEGGNTNDAFLVYCDMTSDGGAKLQDYYDLVPQLQPHVKVVSANQLVSMALQQHKRTRERMHDV